MPEIRKRKVVLANSAEAADYYPTGTVFIIIGDCQAPPAPNCFCGYFLVSRPRGLTHLVFSLDFVPLDPLEQLVAVSVLSGERGWHVELPEEFRFYTAIREPDAGEHLKSFYGLPEALGLLLAVNDMESLDALAVKPDWSRYGVNGDLHGYNFDTPLTRWMGYEDRCKSAVQAVRLIVQLPSIPIGKDGAVAFEEWCYQVVRLLFKGSCDPIYLKPNGQAANRRDIVATNLGEKVFSKRILDDYEARHVVFEVKNSSEIDVHALRQAASYAGGSYGKFAFLIWRSDDEGLDKRGRWRFRNMYKKDGVVVVQLSTAFLLRVLTSVSRCEGRCAIEREFVKLLDTYLLEYANEPPPGKGQLSME